MVVLIILNIVLIIAVIFLAIYIIHDNKKDIKSVCVNCDDDVDDDDDKVEIYKHKQNVKEKTERVFVGRFITDEEYQQMKSNKRSDISVLLEEVDKEYEHLKELNK